MLKMSQKDLVYKKIIKKVIKFMPNLSIPIT